MNKFYLTTAIPYVNAPPHIGHALEFVQADVIKRYQKLIGKEAYLLSGADENSLKIVQAAQEAKITPQELADRVAGIFRDLAKRLDVEFDFFQRASDKEKHFKSSQRLWELCEKKGDIYKKVYEGLYCVGCEAFYTSAELSGGECPEHKGKKIEMVREENYFFKLSRYQRALEEMIEKDKLKIFPQTRKNEVLSFIKQGLADFSISRSRERARGWGVPVPNDPNQVIYVWFDALNIYQSGVGFGWDEKLYQKLWPADLHVIGKGIIRFHAVFWPAILLSSGLPIPKSLFVHGYLTVDGQKMSKTLGNVINPFDLIKKYGKDALRFYFLKEIPSDSDGDFSEKRFKEVYNAGLANGLGNLVARIAKLAQSLRLEVNPTHPKPLLDTPFRVSLEKYEFHEAINYIWQKIHSLDSLIEEKKPWELIKSNPEGSREVVENLIRQVREIAELLQPILPETSEKIRQIFHGPKIVKPSEPLFPRIN